MCNSSKFDYHGDVRLGVLTFIHTQWFDVVLLINGSLRNFRQPQLSTQCIFYETYTELARIFNFVGFFHYHSFIHIIQYTCIYI